MPSDRPATGISVRGTEIRAGEARQHYREKIAHLIKPVDISTLERALNSAHGEDGHP